MTLVELLIASSILSVLLAGLASFAMFNARSLAVITNWAEVDQVSRNAMDIISRDVRQASGVLSLTNNAVTLEYSDGAPMTYTFDPENRIMTRYKSGLTVALIRDLDACRFTLLQRNLIEGTTDLYPTDDPKQCKVLRIDWGCSKRILGKPSGVFANQSLRVVIRKQ
jgi:type II secretory pathway pseudopilin PulG